MRFRASIVGATALYLFALVAGCDKVSELAGHAQRKVEEASASKPAGEPAAATPDQATEVVATHSTPSSPQPQPPPVDGKALVASFANIDPTLHSDEEFRKVADLSPDELAAIERVSVASPRMTEEALAIAAKFPALKKLSLESMPVTPEMFKAVAQLEQLEQLSLAEATFTDEALQELAPLVQLKSLNLRKTPITDAGLPVIASFGNLEVLVLRSTGATGATFAGKPKLTKLRVVDLSESSFGVGLPYFKGIHTLEEINIDRSQVKDLDLGRAGDWPALTTANFQNRPITDTAVIAALKNSKKLERVLLRRTEVSNRTLGTLQYCKELKELDVSSTAVNPTGIEALQKILPKASISGS